MKNPNLNLVMAVLPLHSDVDSLYGCIDRNREHLKNLAWAKDATLESTAAYIDQMEDSRVEIFRLIIDSAAPQADYVIGCITLRDRETHYELGYWLDNAYRGQGVMTKIVNDVIGYYAEKAVHARIRAVNKSSRRVLEKNGFIPCIDEHDPEWITFKLNVT